MILRSSSISKNAVTLEKTTDDITLKIHCNILKINLTVEMQLQNPHKKADRLLAFK